MMNSIIMDKPASLDHGVMGQPASLDHGVMGQPASHVFIMHGPTQYGKTSMVNTLSGQQLGDIGRGDGESVTATAKMYSFPDVASLYSPEATLKCGDLPGFSDTLLRMTDADILRSIQIMLIANRVEQIDALFVFQSCAADNIQLRATLQYAVRVFGKKILKSIIVVVTKTDACEESKRRKFIETIKRICHEFKVEEQSEVTIEPLIWVNAPYVSDDDDRNQKQVLKRKLQSIQPYPMAALQELEAEITEVAGHLRDNDPERWKVNEVEVIVPVEEEYIDQEPYEETIQVPKYPTYDDLHREAVRIQPTLPQDWSYPENYQEQVPYASTKTITETVNVPIPKGGFLGLFPYTRWETRQQEKVVPTVEYRTETRQRIRLGTPPLEVIMQRLKGEMVEQTTTKYLEVKKTRLHDEQRMQIVIAERYDFEHYRILAAEHLMSQIWEARRVEAPANE